MGDQMGDYHVSIQLVSPTSGESQSVIGGLVVFMNRFHSISFPNEWGVHCGASVLTASEMPGFHSISFPNEWGALLTPKAAPWYTFPFN